jgi:hypothetical protein
MEARKSGKLLFNRREAWVRAKGVLKEILQGLYSDPSGIKHDNIYKQVE